MTSTVLDVTVFLLCVSASVGTLLISGPASQADTPDAQATADRIATVTATVTFAVSTESGQEVRRHQATLSALLANAVVSSATAAPPSHDDPAAPGGGDSDADAASGEPAADTPTYTGAVVDLVGRHIDARTRVLAHSPERPARVVVGSKPPRDADVAVASFSVPVGAESEEVRIVVQRWSHG